ncbi:MAG: serine/threonine-protein kinase [Chloroflexi bacterium]|nr:serine/threonine-protein kinase [Chloroflexota bacterium]
MQNHFSPGSQFRQYRLLEQIGAGGFGMVWSALDQNENRIVAIKLFFVDGENQDSNNLFDPHFTSLHHPHVVPTYDFGAWQNIRFIVSPYIPGGSLEDRIHAREALQIQDAIKYAAEIGSALDYLHAENIIHRDLKPANILIGINQHLYVADFDLARVVSKTTQAMHTGRGTPAYSPPEQHNMSAITPQSDIFCFGIVLYELFTHKLPWNNEKYLGIQLLSSNEQIPDPAEINPDLPTGLVKILRKMTAANPAERPASAGEALQMIYACFGMEPIAPVDDVQQDTPTRSLEAQLAEAAELIRQGLEGWEKNRMEVSLNLTKFAIIDIKYNTAQPGTLPANTLRFLLTHALYYGYKDEYWWDKTGQTERLAVARQYLKKGNESVAERIIIQLEKDHKIQALKIKITDELSAALLKIAFNTNKDALRDQILALLPKIIQAPARWQKIAFSAEYDPLLAALAVQEDHSGDLAAQLIGHVHSEDAVMAVLKSANKYQRMPVFNTIRKSAGSLPSRLPLKLRLGVTSIWLQQILSARPISLLSVFGMAFLGTSLGTGLQIYLTYRLPSFMDLERIAISLERGGLLGLIFGTGILVSRLIAERLSILNSSLRVFLSTILGGLFLNIGLFTYDVLILKNVPDGLLISAGCLLIAFGFAIRPYLRSISAKMLVSALAICTALAGSWWVHTSLASSPTSLSPIFFYDYTWSNLQVFGTVLLATLPIAILGNLFDLSLNPDQQ